MQIIKLSMNRGSENVTSLAMGMFDGLHIGHMRLSRWRGRKAGICREIQGT